MARAWRRCIKRYGAAQELIRIYHCWLLTEISVLGFSHNSQKSYNDNNCNFHSEVFRRVLKHIFACHSISFPAYPLKILTLPWAYTEYFRVFIPFHPAGFRILRPLFPAILSLHLPRWFKLGPGDQPLFRDLTPIKLPLFHPVAVPLPMRAPQSTHHPFHLNNVEGEAAAPRC